MTFRTFRPRGPGGSLFILLGILACQSGDKPSQTGTPATQASTPTTSGTSVAAPEAAPPSLQTAAAEKPSAKDMRKVLATPVPQEEIDRAVNPKGLPVYTGPTGTVRGVVRVKGDAALEHPDVLRAIAAGCDAAVGMYGKTPREGSGRTVADVLVAVTGYDAYVPQQEAARVVRGVGCAWETRTVALTFGQTLRIAAGDRRAYVPDLMGQKMPAQLFAMPGAEPVSLPPRKPGRYRLVDSMRLYSIADVFVVAYPTVSVTGVDGRFEISGVPVGKAKLNALLPVTMAVAERDVEVSAERPVEVELTIEFDVEAYKALKVDLK
jgi:hypothetical protein